MEAVRAVGEGSGRGVRVGLLALAPGWISGRSLAVIHALASL